MKKTLMFLLGMSALDNIETHNVGQELLVNGNFAVNNCKHPVCIYKNPNEVLGWTPDPEIEVGPGAFYNSRLGKQDVVQLAGNRNTCIFQTVRNLTPGIYQLLFEYAAREGRFFDDSQISVLFNGRQLSHVLPSNYNVNTDVVNFEVRQSEGQIKFCGVGGVDNGEGAVLKSTSLIRKENLPGPQSLLLRYPPGIYPPGMKSYWNRPQTNFPQMNPHQQNLIKMNPSNPQKLNPPKRH